MRKFAAILCCCIAGLMIAGCNNFSSDDNGPIRRYPNFQISCPGDKLITDPYFWSRLQFANGDVLDDGANPNDYPICYANADINGAPGDELFIRDDVFGMKNHRVMVFEKESGGYRFIGWFDAGTVTVTDKGIIIAGPADGTKCMLAEYRYMSTSGGPGRLIRFSSSAQPMMVGQGAQEKSNEGYANLIKNGKTLQWTEY